MKNSIIRGVVVSALVLVVGGFLGMGTAHAMTPSLTLYATGNGDMVQITINGDANSGVWMYYQKYGYGMQSLYMGTSNSNGNLTTSLSTSSLGVSNGSSAYVVVNNQQSSNVVWPFTSGNTAVTLSQTSLSIAMGQSANITVSGGTAPYIMYSTLSNVFQSVIGGNTLTIIPIGVGSGNLSVCSNGQSQGSSGCATLSITVSNTLPPPISLSPSTVNLAAGSTSTVVISGTGNYYISSNTNSSVASAYISGNSLIISGVAYGTNTITVCQSYGQCASVYVSVTSGGSVVIPITFSQANPTLNVGQNLSISIYGGSGGSYYVAYNSNSSSVLTTINGSTITLKGLANSATVVVVCSTSNTCGAITAMVGQSSFVNWVYCANENGACNFSGTRQVRYGANGSYYYRTFTNYTQCSNAVFGDPLFGVVKQCSYLYSNV